MVFQMDQERMDWILTCFRCRVGRKNMPSRESPGQPEPALSIGNSSGCWNAGEAGEQMEPSGVGQESQQWHHGQGSVGSIERQEQEGEQQSRKCT